MSWLQRDAVKVTSCPGFKMESEATYVASPTARNRKKLVALVLGSFSVKDVAGCMTTKVLLKYLEAVAACAAADIPDVCYVDLSPGSLPTAQQYKDLGGSELHFSPQPDDPLWRAAITDAQAYSDEVAAVLAAQGFTVFRLVLSTKVHNCYKLAGCANAAVQYLHYHPCALRGCLEKIRGMQTEIQLFFAHMAFAAGDFGSVEGQS